MLQTRGVACILRRHLRGFISIADRKGRLRGEGDAASGGGGFELFGKLLEQCLGFVGSVAIADRINGQQIHRAGIEFGLDVAVPADSDDEESGDQQQHERRGNLSHHQEIAQTEATVTRQLQRGTFFERGSEIGFGGLQSGRQAESNATDEREAKSEKGRMPVHAEVGFHRYARLGGKAAGQFGESVGDREPRGSAEQ